MLHLQDRCCNISQVTAAAAAAALRPASQSHTPHSSGQDAVYWYKPTAERIQQSKQPACQACRDRHAHTQRTWKSSPHHPLVHNGHEVALCHSSVQLQLLLIQAEGCNIAGADCEGQQAGSVVQVPFIHVEGQPHILQHNKRGSDAYKPAVGRSSEELHGTGKGQLMKQ